MARLDPGDLARACARHGLAGVVEDLRRLTGGASRETWSFDLVPAAHGRPRVPLVLRRDPTSAAAVLDRDVECRLIEAAGAAGVPVPKVSFVLDEDDRIGTGFVMERVEGETIPRKILRDDAFASARPLLCAQAGSILAAIHSVDWRAISGLALADSDDDPASVQVRQYRGILDVVGEAHPAFELGLRWLDDHLPRAGARTLVHGDYRNGNLIVGPEGIRAVLDWELAHAGDPMEDLGWMCVRSWRFGADDRPAGGFGTYDELFAAYEDAGGRAVDPESVRFWEAFGTLKWGILCLVQALSFRSGANSSVELAALGRRACEMEYDLLALIDR
ncbi:MAG: phosphotransferase family protein [Acidimicrobiia bacterium]|nr:phosphotransferase family protein [Acidimicrobiia bacterium]